MNTVYAVLLASEIFGDLPKICYWRYLNLAMGASIVWHNQSRLHACKVGARLSER